jgi:hypothetical protein
MQTKTCARVNRTLRRCKLLIFRALNRRRDEDRLTVVSSEQIVLQRLAQSIAENR